MIADEVDRYREEMLAYLRARPVDPNENEDEQSFAHQYYTTAAARRTYEIQPPVDRPADSASNDGRESHRSTSTRSAAEENPRSPPETAAFLTEDTSSRDETMSIPFHQAFRIPANLADSVIYM